MSNELSDMARMQLKQKWVDRAEAVVLGLMAIPAGVFIAFYGYWAWHTIAYPFPLDWAEGNLLVPVMRILEGHQPYSRPTADYVPNLYMPLFFYVSAFIDLFVGQALLAARLVSFLAVVGIGIVTYQWVRKEGGNRMLAFNAAGLFFATFKISGCYFNMARVDSLFFFMLLSGFYVALYPKTPKSGKIAGLLFTAALFTKQSALIAILPLLAVGMLINRKHWGIIYFWFMGPSLLLAVLLNEVSGGWFTFFVFILPSHHNISEPKIAAFWTRDLWAHMWPCCVLGMCAGVMNFRKGWKYGALFLTLFLGCIGLSYISRLHDGGWINVLIPAFYVLIFSSVLQIIHMREWIDSTPFSWIKAGLYFLPLLLLIEQYSLLRYDPRKLIPSEHEWEAGRKFTDYLRHIDGDVLIPRYPYLQTYAGKKSYGWGTAGWDIFRMTPGKVRGDFINDVNMQLRNGKFSALFLYGDEMDYLRIGGPYCYKETILTGARDIPLNIQEQALKVYVKCSAP